MWVIGTALLMALLAGGIQSQQLMSAWPQWGQILVVAAAAGMLPLIGAAVACRRLTVRGRAWCAAKVDGVTATEWVAAEISHTRDLGKVVASQLGSVIQETEKAAYNISSRLADIDGKVVNLDEMVATSIVDVGRLAADSAKEIDGNKELIDAMNNYIQFRMQESESDRVRVSQLTDQAKALTGLVDLIKGIAQQTNLLSLNAAIEAARVGALGKGFSVVAGEVRMLSRETEKAVNQINHGIASVAQSIHSLFHHKVDEDNINQERDTLNRFAEQLNQLNQKYGKLITAQTNVALTMGGNSRELKELFMDAMSSIQFQDITRQQIEQIVATLTRMDEHFAHLSEHLLSDGAGREQRSILTDMENIYDTYVMDSQRTDHQKAAGSTQPRANAGATVAPSLPTVELF